MDMAQQTISNSGTGYWRIGLVLSLIAAAVIVGEGAQYFAAVVSITDTAVKQVRDSHPDAAWAFQEWDDCQRGRGRYAEGQEPVFFTQDQCKAAVTTQAEHRGAQGPVIAALNTQSSAAAAAESSVKPAWPLSLLY